MDDIDLSAGLLDPPKPRRGGISRDRILQIARSDNIPDDIADDFAKVMSFESGGSHFDRRGKVKLSPPDPKTGERAVGATQIKPSTAKGVGVDDPFDEDKNLLAGLRYFRSGGDDPAGRRIHYFGGPRALKRYQSTGRIPKGKDVLGTTFEQYVKSTGGEQKQKPKIDLSAGFEDNELASGLQDSGQNPPPSSELKDKTPDKQNRRIPVTPAKAKSVPNTLSDVIEAGNIDLSNRPRVRNPDGSISTVRSMSVNIDGREVLLPTVSDDGRNLSRRQAVEQYKRTGKHLGVFASPQAATRYAEQLHDEQARQLRQPRQLFDRAIPRVLDMLVPADRSPTFAEDRAQRAARQKDIDILKGRAGAATDFAGEEYNNFLRRNRQLDSPNMRDQFLTLKAKQAMAASSGSPHRALLEQNREAARQERVAKISTARKAAQVPLSLASGLTEGVGSSVKGLSVAGKGIADRLTDTRGLSAEDTYLYRLGDYVQKRVPEIIGSNPDLEQEFFIGKAPQAVGQSISFLLGGLATKAPKTAVTILGAGMSAGSAYDEVKAAGGTEEQAVNAGLLAGAILGPSELLGMRGAMKAISGTAKEATINAALKTALREGRRDVIENALQEAGQEFGQGLITGQRRSPEQLAEAALLGGLASGIVTPSVTLATQVGGRRAREAEAQPDVTAQPETAESATREGASSTTGGQDLGDVSGLLQPRPETVQPAPRRFYHRDFGEVEILADQTGAGKNKYRVAEVADPTKQHFVKKSHLTGRGNERMVPVKLEPSVESTVGPETEANEALRLNESLEAGIVEPSESEAFLRDESDQPLTLYHHTTKEAKDAILKTGFDLSKGRARLSDEAVPDGVFFTPSDKTPFSDPDIEFARIDANLAAKNPLHVQNRDEIRRWASERNDEYARITEDLSRYTYDEMGRLYRELQGSDKAAAQRAQRELESLNEKATRGRAILTDLLKSEGYDSLIMERDEAGPQVTKTYVVLDPKQVRIKREANTSGTTPKGASVPPVPKGYTRYYRADRPEAEGPEGGGWSNNLNYVSQKYGAGASGAGESVWYVDVPSRTLESEYGDVQSASILRGDPKELGATEPRLYRRVSVSAPSQPASKPANKISAETTKPAPRKSGAERAAYGQSTKASLAQFVRRSGGITPTETHRGELDRLRAKEMGSAGAFLVGSRKQGGIEQSADIMMQMANDAGYRDPNTGQPFENPGDFLRAVESDALGTQKIYVRTGSEDFSAAEAEYYGEQESRVRAEEARNTFLESGRGAELFDRIVDREASDAERQEYIELAERAGISRAESEDLIADARAEVESLQGDGAEGTQSPSRPAEPALEAEVVKPWEMTRDQIEEEFQRRKAEDDNIEVSVFGPELAKKYNRLQRIANSTTKSHEETDAAYDEVARMEAALSERDRNKLYGIGETGPQLDDLRDYRQSLGNLDPHDPQSLAESMRWAVSRVGNETDPAKMTHGQQVAYGTLREAARIAHENGWDTQAISREAVKAAGTRFSDPDDARFMLDRFLKKEKPPEAPKRKQIGPAEQLGFVQEGLTQQTAPARTEPQSALAMNAEQFRRYRAKRDAEIADRHGKGYAKKYWQAADRLFNASDVAEYRANGVIVKEGDGYTLHVFGDTDSPSAKWRVGAKIDVSDQFQAKSELNPERTAALAKLEEIRRRGMTVDDYARQPDLMGNVPSAEEVRQLKEAETGNQPSEESGQLNFGPGTMRAGEPLPEVKERKFGKRFTEDERIADEIRSEIGTAKYYEPIPNKITAEQAKRLVDERGVGESIRIIRDEKNDLAPHIRATMGQMVILKLNQTYRNLKAAGSDKAAGVLDQAVDLAEWAMDYGTRLGQGVQSFAMWARLTPEGMLLTYKRAVKKARERHQKLFGEDVAEIVNTINREGMTEAEREQALRDLFKTNKTAKKVKTDFDKLLEAAKTGKLTDTLFYEIVGDKLGLPGYNKETAAKITDLAQRIEAAPEGLPRTKLVLELQKFIAEQKGFDVVDLPLGIFYGNILSGYNTHAVNFADTGLNVLAEINGLALNNPQAAAKIYAGMLRGFVEGRWDAMLAMTEGRMFRDSKWLDAPGLMEVAKFGQKGGVPIKTESRVGRFAKRAAESKIAIPLNAYKYVSRAMSASDAVMARSASEARSTLLAYKMAKDEGLKGDALEARVREILALDRQADFMAQAEREGFTGKEAQFRANELREMARPKDLTADAAEFAGEATYNHKPHGTLGMFAESIGGLTDKFKPLKMFVPFTRIVANVTNRGLNWTPYGYKRAFMGWGFGKNAEPLTAEDRRQMLTRATLGTAGLVLLGVLQEAGLLAIHGNGPNDREKRRQLMNAGWRPYSIQIGDAYVSYLYSPIGLGLSILGNWTDASRYHTLEQQDAATKAAYSVVRMGSTVFSQSFLSGLTRLFDALSDDSYKSVSGIKRSLSGTVSGFTTPNIARDMYRLFDNKAYQSNTLMEDLIRNTPFAVTGIPGVMAPLKPALNAFGEPVRLQRQRFFDIQSSDPAWKFVIDKGLRVPVPGRTIEMEKGRRITPEEYYELLKTTGPKVKDWIIKNRTRLSRMKEQDAQDELSEAAARIRKFELVKMKMRARKKGA